MGKAQVPVVSLFTLVKCAGEYALVEVVMRGDEVVSREVLEQGRQFRPIWAAFQDATKERFYRFREQANG